MSIGEDLASARRQAGLTLAQVSKQTCIRETIIGAIEQDDYRVCGGDFYTRGHIRAIAHAVGADPEPLIAEYDAAHYPPHLVCADLPGPAKRTYRLTEAGQGLLEQWAEALRGARDEISSFVDRYESKEGR